MEKRYQIFISSTYEDLKEERKKVTEVILNLGHFPIGMELFNAGDSEQWEQIKHAIDESDYYILILAQRYGSMTNEKISYTEKEYNYAREKNIPILSFIIKDDVPVLKKYIDIGSKVNKLNNFKQRVKLKSCAFWEDTNDLGLKVSESLQAEIKKNPQLGWIKINDDKKYNIISNGIEEYFEVSINRLKKILKEGTYIDSFERDISILVLKNKNRFKVTTTTKILFKNVNNGVNFYKPNPTFNDILQFNTYKNTLFEINHENQLSRIEMRKEEREIESQMKYVISNDIDYTDIDFSDGIYIKHRTEYYTPMPYFFQFWQLQYPCKSLCVNCELENEDNTFEFVCSSASAHRPRKRGAYVEEISKNGSRTKINFGEWSDVGDGFTVTLKKV